MMEESDLAHVVCVQTCPQFSNDLSLALFCRYLGNGGCLFDGRLNRLDDRVHS